MAESVLVLSGGGAHGAFQVGVLKRLVELGRSWDYIAGVSVGAINGAFLAQYPREAAREAVADLERFWLDIKGNKSIFKPWLFHELAALWRGGLYNTKPLAKLIDKYLDPAKLKTSGVELRVGVTSLEDGDYEFISGWQSAIRSWVLASSAFPVAFPSVSVNGKHYIDGGVRNVTPLEDVLNEGHRRGDLILASPHSRSAGAFPASKTMNVLSVAMRTALILASEVAYDDLAELAKTCNGWKTFAPEESLSDNSLNFDPVEIRAFIAQGYESVKE